MINELLNSWERRSHCENNFGNAVPRRSRWKRSLTPGRETQKIDGRGLSHGAKSGL